MHNKSTGYIIMGIAGLIGFIIFSFNKALAQIVDTSCSHGPSCPMWGTIDFQTNIGIGILVFVMLIGLYFIFLKKDEPEHKPTTIIQQISQPQITPPKISKDNYKETMQKLNNEEKIVFEKVIESEGTIFQSDLVEKTQFNKVKVTRILDRLEGLGIIERKRRGMTNVVVLKH